MESCAQELQIVPHGIPDVKQPQRLMRSRQTTLVSPFHGLRQGVVLHDYATDGTATQRMIDGAAQRYPPVFEHELKNRFIYNLLHGLVADDVAILRDAAILGMDFTPPRAVILIDAADYILSADIGGRTAADEQIRRRAQFVISTVVSFFHLPNDTICAYIGDGAVAVLKASDTKNLVVWADRDEGANHPSSTWANLNALKRAGAELLQRLRNETGAAISLGVGRHHPGIRGLTRSYADARAALSLGRRCHGQNGVHCLDSLGVAAFVGVPDEQTKIELATHLLSPLDDGPELIKTLKIFFAQNCCPSASSQQLAIHRNTLSYRLDKITALIGLDPRKFDDAVQIRLALVVRSLRDQLV